MNSDLEKINKASMFKVEEGTYVYAKVSEASDQEQHFMVSRDADEITVVTKEENLAELDILERNKDSYCLIALNVSVPFYSVGFLATVSQAIADKGMNILIVSTYSKDYILMKDEKIEKAKTVLLALCFQESK